MNVCPLRRNMNKFDDKYIEKFQNQKNICRTCWKYPFCEKRIRALKNNRIIDDCDNFL